MCTLTSVLTSGTGELRQIKKYFFQELIAEQFYFGF
jgi:hypothetical protein